MGTQNLDWKNTKGNKMKRPQIEKYEYNPKTNTVEINGKFEIDFYTGTIWYSKNYTGKRSEFLPNYIFLIRDSIQMSHRILRAMDNKERNKALKGE